MDKKITKEQQETEDMILKSLEKSFADVFSLYMAARVAMDKAAKILSRARLLMGTRNGYQAILDDPNGDRFIETERILSGMETGSVVLRSYILELEKAQLKKATKNDLLDNGWNDDLH